MLPDRVSNPGPLAYESGALPIALRGQAREEPALAAMHGPHSVSDIGDCTVINGDAGGVSLVDQ